MVFCSKCGIENDEVSKFCIKCGHILEQQKEIKVKFDGNKKNNKNKYYVVISIITLFSVIAAAYYFSLEPDFSFTNGNFDTKLVSILPPSVELNIDFFVRNNGSASAHNIIAKFDIISTENNVLLSNTEILGTLEPNEIKKVEMIFTISTNIEGIEDSYTQIIISSDETQRIFDHRTIIE